MTKSPICVTRKIGLLWEKVAPIQRFNPKKSLSRFHNKNYILVLASRFFSWKMTCSNAIFCLYKDNYREGEMLSYILKLNIWLRIWYTKFLKLRSQDIFSIYLFKKLELTYCIKQDIVSKDSLISHKVQERVFIIKKHV